MRTDSAEDAATFFSIAVTPSIPDRRVLREQLRARRDALPARERVMAAQGLASNLEQLPEFLVDRSVAGYWAVGGELPLNAAVARLLVRGQCYLLPLLAQGPAPALRFAAWRPGQELLPNRYGIPEPSVDFDAQLDPTEINLVLLPLLGFDRRGNRLGTGGGYYDRSFAFLKQRERPTEPLLVGVGYSFQEVAELRAEPWDVPLDFIATERELIECSIG